MPRITVKAMAEMLRLPAYQQLRVLTEQKYPRQQPQIFRTPYYQPALSGIREFYRTNNNRSAITRARQAAQELTLDSRRLNNIRVLDRFESSTQYNRRLAPIANPRLSTTLGTIDLRLSADLRARDSQGTRVIYYNCRSAALDEEVALNALEIAHWLLRQNGQEFPTGAVEFFDLTAGRLYRLPRRRPSVIRLLRNNVRIIETLWETI